MKNYSTKNYNLTWIHKLVYLLSLVLMVIQLNGQQVEVEGKLRVTQLEENNTQQKLVVQNDDGTLGFRRSSSLPGSGGIDSTRNLASDFELAKFLCECQSFPPFLINRLLNSGYTEDDLLNAGVPFNNIQDAQPITDGDGNVYTAITIGSQTWLRENLRTTRTIDGTPLATGGSWSGYSSSGTAAYTTVNNSSIYTEDYGLMYNWYAVENDDVCPVGYRVPTIVDWQNLDALSSSDAVLLKEKGFDYWVQPNQLSINSTGYSARGAGRRSTAGTYNDFRSRTR
ncbi:MAG: FISUMP domain-containing protein, partial [Bacteroidota bacterium]